MRHYPRLGLVLGRSLTYPQNPVQEGEVGEIYIAGQGLAVGYIGCHSHLGPIL